MQLNYLNARCGQECAAASRLGALCDPSTLCSLHRGHSTRTRRIARRSVPPKLCPDVHALHGSSLYGQRDLYEQQREVPVHCTDCTVTGPRCGPLAYTLRSASAGARTSNVAKCTKSRSPFSLPGTEPSPYSKRNAHSATACTLQAGSSSLSAYQTIHCVELTASHSTQRTQQYHFTGESQQERLYIRQRTRHPK